MRNKYGNKKTVLDGITFDSIREAERYAELKLMEKAGMIQGLERQMPFTLQEGFRDKYGKWQRAIKYVADFTYYMNGEFIIEDVKSPATRQDKVYKLKKKMLMKQGLYITEV